MVSASLAIKNALSQTQRSASRAFEIAFAYQRRHRYSRRDLSENREPSINLLGRTRRRGHLEKTGLELIVKPWPQRVRHRRDRRAEMRTP
ncbi:MAG: hypothetical protein WCL32_09440, partial [Planctomycetota bacterium]